MLWNHSCSVCLERRKTHRKTGNKRPTVPGAAKANKKVTTGGGDAPHGGTETDGSDSKGFLPHHMSNMIENGQSGMLNTVLIYDSL